VARVLIVGCGCRGAALTRELIAAGHVVRGTTRDPARTAEIEDAGAEAAVADPDRLGSIMAHLAGVSVVCWLMGTARGPSAADLHGARLRTLLERLVDTPVRGFVYEGSADGATAVREAGATWRIPVEVVDADPANHAAWLAASTAAVGRVL
jgi:nucleoside-diphosphate-sugar epimerase